MLEINITVAIDLNKFAVFEGSFDGKKFLEISSFVVDVN